MILSPVVGDTRQPVDPVVGDPVRQDNDKIWILGMLSPPSVYFNKEIPYKFVYRQKR